MSTAPNRELDTSRLSAIGFVATIAVFVVILGLQVAYLAAERRELARKERSAPPLPRVALAEQRARLDRYRKLDPQGRTWRIPIERAIDLVVRDRRRVATERD